MYAFGGKKCNMWEVGAIRILWHSQMNLDSFPFDHTTKDKGKRINFIFFWSLRMRSLNLYDLSTYSCIFSPNFAILIFTLQIVVVIASLWLAPSPFGSPSLCAMCYDMLQRGHPLANSTGVAWQLRRKTSTVGEIVMTQTSSPRTNSHHPCPPSHTRCSSHSWLPPSSPPSPPHASPSDLNWTSLSCHGSRASQTQRQFLMKYSRTPPDQPLPHCQHLRLYSNLNKLS